MARFNVVMTSGFLAVPAVAVLEAAGCAIHYMRPYPSAEEVAAATGAVQADAILTRQGPVTAAAMDASPRLRVIARHGVGVDDVDLAAAAGARHPGDAGARLQHRGGGRAHDGFHPGTGQGSSAAGGGDRRRGWRAPAGRVRDLRGLRLGLLGFGGIAQAVVPMARGFGMEVSAFSPSLRAGAGVAGAVSLEALLAGCDVLSVHCPLIPATRHLIDAAALAGMPSGSYVVNTSRGGIVDEAALAASLDSGWTAGAALDVFEGEPPVASHPLRDHPRVIATPHIGGVTEASLVAMGVMAAECIAWALTGQDVPDARIVRG